MHKNLKDYLMNFPMWKSVLLGILKRCYYIEENTLKTEQKKKGNYHHLENKKIM